MTLDEIADDILKQEDYQLSKAFTMVIGSLLISRGIQPIINKSCEEWNANDDLNKYIIRKAYNVTFDIDTSEHDKEIYNKALEDLVKLICTYYTMQEKAGYCADTNNMIKRRIADFAEQLKKGAE